MGSGTLDVVKPLERLVVHVEEAIRYGTAADEPRLRLGLMLLDSAAELMMYRETDYLIRMNAHLYDRWLEIAEQQVEQTGTGQDRVEEYRALAISKTRRRKIDREFDAKCDYLVEEGLLPEPHSRALKKLHKYRNDTYHRDELRPATLSNATAIYTYLVCTMMSELPPHQMGYMQHDPPEVIAKYLKPGENGFGVSFELQGRIGQALLASSGVAVPMALGQSLSEHVLYRLEEIEGAIEECVSYIGETHRNEKWDLNTVLGMLQAPVPDDKFEYLTRTPEQLRGWAKPVNAAKLAEWRQLAEDLATESDDLTAFTSFADLEDEFEPIEQKAMEFALQVDLHIQDEIDAARGK